MKVSVICPTFNRQDRHANLYQAFIHQDYVDKELLILDDSQEKSEFFSNLNDPKVTYRHTPSPVSSRASVGFKRNLLVEMASGEVIAHFDDDDYYAPTYLTKMIGELGNADLIKLSKWLAWWEFNGTLWLCDTQNVTEVPFVVYGHREVTRFDKMIGQSSEWMKQFNTQNMWGYGFSYVYRKSLWEDCCFENMNFGEDYSLIHQALLMGKIAKHTPDLFQLALHTIHANSTSIIFPQSCLGDKNTAISIVGQESAPWLITNKNSS
jgi:glycosyltransferase involved in cell wall biosynthesis